MANFISDLPVLLPLSKQSHVCIIWFSGDQIDNSYRRVVHILIAWGKSSGQCLCILLNKWSMILKYLKEKRQKREEDCSLQ